MKPNQFASLAIAAAVSLMLALAAYTAQTQRSTAIPAGTPLFSGITSNADKIARIEMSQGARSLTLERSGEQWSIKEKGGFRASTDKVRAMIASLAEAALAEAKTSNEARHPLLELEDPKGENANSHLVRLTDSEGKAIAEVIVGKKRFDAFGTGKAGSYVRRPGEAQTWLVTREIAPSLTLKSWVRERLFATTPERITRAKVELTGDTPVEIEREENGKSFRLSKIPDGKKLKYENSVDDIIDTLSSFNIDDVQRPPQSPPAATATGKATFGTDKGLELEITARKESEKTWFSLAAHGEGEGKAAADDLNDLAAGWEFKIPANQFDRIFRKLGDLLEDKTS
jgi:hypothetical protein